MLGLLYVKKFATEHKIKFGEALPDKRCSASYKSLQTSVPNKGPMSFVPIDAVPKKKSAKKNQVVLNHHQKELNLKTKTNSKSKVTKGRSRGKKSVTKTQSAGFNLYQSRLLFVLPVNKNNTYYVVWAEIPDNKTSVKSPIKISGIVQTENKPSVNQTIKKITFKGKRLISKNYTLSNMADSDSIYYALHSENGQLTQNEGASYYKITKKSTEIKEGEEGDFTFKIKEEVVPNSQEYHDFIPPTK